jgi:hypothetical protein
MSLKLADILLAMHALVKAALNAIPVCTTFENAPDRFK